MPRLAVDQYAVGVDPPGSQQAQFVRDGLSGGVVRDGHDAAQLWQDGRVVWRRAGHASPIPAGAHGRELAGLGVALAR